MIYPFTRFKRGFAFFAFAEAPRVEAASSAEASFVEIPCFFAIPAATFLKPG